MTGNFDDPEFSLLISKKKKQGPLESDQDQNLTTTNNLIYKEEEDTEKVKPDISFIKDYEFGLFVDETVFLYSLREHCERIQSQYPKCDKLFSFLLSPSSFSYDDMEKEYDEDDEKLLEQLFYHTLTYFAAFNAYHILIESNVIPVNIQDRINELNFYISTSPFSFPTTGSSYLPTTHISSLSSSIEHFSDVDFINPSVRVNLMPKPLSKLDYVIVIILEGPDDDVTYGVFEDTASLLVDSLQQMGYFAGILSCTNILTCYDSFRKEGGLKETAQWIILAPHHLSSFVMDVNVIVESDNTNSDELKNFSNDSGEVQVQSLPIVWLYPLLNNIHLIPPTSILFNMEHVPNHTPTATINPNQQQGKEDQRQNSLLSSEIIKIYSNYPLWDYCQSNILRWKDIYNLHHVQYLPLGFSPILHYTKSSTRHYLSEFMSACYQQYMEYDKEHASTSIERKENIFESNKILQNGTGITLLDNGTKSEEEHNNSHEAALLFSAARKEMIDVLFYGHLLPYRAAIIQELRAAGIRVYHANAVSYVQETVDRDQEESKNGHSEPRAPVHRQLKRNIYGRNLDDLIANSKIVLNLLSFGEEEEWKLTRLLKPLANAKCIVSEIHGTKEEREYLNGVVFTERNQLVNVIQGLLKDENWREKQGQLARKSFSRMTMVESLSRHISRYSNL